MKRKGLLRPCPSRRLKRAAKGGRWGAVAKLNQAQRAAVEHEHGPLLVLAGAGSGKTRVITQRIARLVDGGVRPEQILGVTFTNKAAREMVERLGHAVGAERAGRVWLSTFHSFGVRLLQEESESLGYGKRFVIFDQGDCLGLIRDLLRREMPTERNLDKMAILSRISLWKNAFRTPEEVPYLDYEYDAIARELYPHYENALTSMRAVDFDDLVVKTVRILEQNESVRLKWQRRFRHLLVDEFQDTNRSQMRLVSALLNELRNVCVVGDDDQSIYSWRGADVGNILEFDRHFPGSTIVKLEDNYRSKAQILEVANAAIARSRDGRRHRKELRPARGPGERVRIAKVPDTAAEAELVVREIRRLRSEGKAFASMAVLYRSNTQSKILEEELRIGGIPFRLYGGTQLFDRKEVKDAIAFLRVLVQPHDELSLRRIVNYPPRGIGDSSVERISASATAKGVSFAHALRDAHGIDGLSDAAQGGIGRLLGAFRQARSRLESGTSLEMTARGLFEDVGMVTDLENEPGEVGRHRRANLDFVLKSIARFERTEREERPSFAQFLARMALTGGDEAPVQDQRVTLSSLHSAKGLEFDTVFLIGCVEGRLPHLRSTDPKATDPTPTDVEEERRLFYVGVTRARDRLFLSVPKQRTTRGRVVPLAPSRFLQGLPEEAIEHYQHEGQSSMSADEIAAASDALLAGLRNR